MRKVTRTLYGASLQTARSLGLPYDIPEYTTVSEALNDPQIIPFQPAQQTAGMEYAQAYNFDNDTINLKTQYFCIGHGGHRFINGALNGVPKDSPIPHRTTNSGLYKIIPFVVRPIGDDLSSQDRTKFRLRKVIEIGGDLYAAYYARKLNLEDTSPVMKITSVVDGVSTTSVFTPTASNMKPVPPPVGVENDGSLGHVSSNVRIPFNEQDIIWLREASEILYGDPDYAIISEIAVCSGAEKQIVERYPQSGTQTSVSVTGESLIEAVGVQPMAFISCYYSTLNTTKEITLEFDLGATEPLYGAD